MPDLRIRVDLSDFVSGLNGMRWMYLAGDKVNLVADLVNVIKEEYEEVKAGDCVNLFLDGFSLPSWEPVKILKDGDIVKGFLSKGNLNKRQLSECDNERSSPKKRRKVEAKNPEVQGSEKNKIKSQKVVAIKNASPKTILNSVKEAAQKKKTQSSSSSSSSSSSYEDEVIKKPSKEVIKEKAMKDSSSSSSSSSEDEKDKKKQTVSVKKVETVTSKNVPSVKTSNVSSSSDDSSSSSEDEQPTKQPTSKITAPVKPKTPQNKDSSSSSDSSSESESDEPTKTPTTAPKTNNAPVKPKRKRKRKNKNKNKLPPSDTTPDQHLPQIAPSPAAWHKSKQNKPPQNNRIVFEDQASETFTDEQIQELYKMSKPAKSMPSPRPDLLPKVTNFPKNSPAQKTPIGPSLPNCEAAVLSSQDEKSNSNKTKTTPKIVFHPRVVTFANGDSCNGDRIEAPVNGTETSGKEGGFSSLLNSNGAMFVRSKKSAKDQQLNDVQTNVSVVISNPVNGEVNHEKDLSSMVTQEKKDYSVYHPVSEGGPREGDIIAYKVVEMSENYTPEVSEYKEGKVLEWDGTGKVTLELVNKQIKKKEGRFEVEGMTDDISGEIINQFSWSEIIEPRLIFP